MAFESIEALEQGLREAEYLPDRGLATALYLATRLEKPVLLEGEAGVASVLTILRNEIELGLALLGCTSPDQVGRSHVEPTLPYDLLA